MKSIIAFSLLIIISLPTFASKNTNSDSCANELTTKEYFPSIKYNDKEGGYVGEAVLNVDTIYEGYSKGLFPWIDNGATMSWFSPPNRGIILLDEVRISRNIKRDLRKAEDAGDTTTINQAFEEVIRGASASTRQHPLYDHNDQVTGYEAEQNWISEAFIQSYTEAFKKGYAYSIETWNKDGELVGGLYGVTLNGLVAGESMFTKPGESGASKLAFIKLITHLKERGFKVLDTQMVTDTMKRLGAKYITRDEYLQMAKEQQKEQITFID